MNTLLSHSCPNCGSPSVRCSRRRGIEGFAPWFGLYSFRCCECALIFFKPVAQETAPVTPAGTVALSAAGD